MHRRHLTVWPAGRPRTERHRQVSWDAIHGCQQQKGPSLSVTPLPRRMPEPGPFPFAGCGEAYDRSMADGPQHHASPQPRLRAWYPLSLRNASAPRVYEHRSQVISGPKSGSRSRLRSAPEMIVQGRLIIAGEALIIATRSCSHRRPRQVHPPCRMRHRLPEKARS
ncbi:MAG: hypothetical protein JWR80_6635 [Bradyrhizobium sp.]|nr:hypothetical protein [Bradyrhizobium sp.]